MPDFTWTPSYEPTESSEPRVRKFKANTGYEQRRRYGINADLKKWSLTFANCNDTEREEILGFLEARGGYEEFAWVTPKSYTGKHVCDEWQARLTSCGRTTITATFRQVGPLAYVAPPEPPEETDPAVDPYAANVSLLLHMDGSNGSTTFTDNSINAHSIVRAGNAQISTVQSKFGGASGYFDGTGDYLNTPTGTAVAFGTSDFTVETWIYISSYSSAGNGGYLLLDTIPNGGVGARANAMAWVLTTTGKLDVFSNNSFRGASTSTVPLNQWCHLALTRNGTTWRYYINGTQDATQYAYTVNLSLATGGQIGKVGDVASYFLNGYIDEFRVTKGVARYTSNFIPPATPFPNP